MGRLDARRGRAHWDRAASTRAEGASPTAPRVGRELAPAPRGPTRSPRYGLFLKAAGLSMEDQLRFFQAEFTKIMSADAFNKECGSRVARTPAPERGPLGTRTTSATATARRASARSTRPTAASSSSWTWRRGPASSGAGIFEAHRGRTARLGARRGMTARAARAEEPRRRVPRLPLQALRHGPPRGGAREDRPGRLGPHEHSAVGQDARAGAVFTRRGTNTLRVDFLRGRSTRAKA